MSIVLDGSNGVTFPNGSNPQAAPSKVLQVVQGIKNNGFDSTTSTSYVATTLSASITPLFSTSKILILLNGCVYNNNSSYVASYAVYRNNTTNLARIMECSLPSGWNSESGCYIDSPATTSSTTYTIYFASGNSSATCYLGGDSPTNNTITLMEIAQ